MEQLGSSLGFVIVCCFLMYACEPKETTAKLSDTYKAFKCEKTEEIK